MPRRSNWTSRIVPIVMLVIVVLAGLSVSEVWSGDTPWRFWLTALVGGIVSLMISRSRLSDGVAVLLALGAGAIFASGITALYSGYLEGSLRHRLWEFPVPVFNALFGDDYSGDTRQMTAEFLLTLTIWLTAWIAMWMLIRVRTSALALIAPWVLLLANQFISERSDTGFLVSMVGLSVVLLVLARLENKESEWTRGGMPISESLFYRVLSIGLVLAIIASGAMMTAPQAWSQSVLEPLITNTVDRLNAVRDYAGSSFGMRESRSSGGSSSQFSSFSNDFSVGGHLQLSAQPEVLVQANTATAPYLVARNYDVYTGSGWSSSSSGYRDESGSVRQSPELRYSPNWEVALSQNVRNQRDPIQIQVTPLTPQNGILLSTDTYLMADVPAIVRMGWISVTDAPYAVTVGTLNQLPPDVQLLGNLLLQSQLAGEPSDWGPTATSPSLQGAINEEVDDLAKRGITVYWDASADGIVQTLYITGRLPIFDDVEAVFQGAALDGDYRITGLTSTASPEQLAAASTDYPAWVTDRYLQTSDTVTDRTRELTREIVGEEANPYRQSVLIEQWLRNNITYDLEVGLPPKGQDLVDYLLFDYRYGYCEHYASAMTVMLRTLGIPARVVVGYSPGQRDAVTGGFLYRQQNAHAWVEAFFPGYGWIPFEPTANRPLGEFTSEPATGANVDTSEPNVTAEVDDAVPPLADVSTPDVLADNSSATPFPTEVTTDGVPPQVVDAGNNDRLSQLLIRGMMVAGGAALMMTGIWMAWNWSLRGLSPAASLMRRLQRVSGWAGIRPGITSTPREYARRFEDRGPMVSEPVKRITKAYEIETYGPGAMRDQVLRDAQHAWRTLRTGLLRPRWRKRIK
ncbi:MAG: transglutaminase domain-containing protein [Thermomicrobiales bacterium]|nr:transglutaminase domain-containing protein [Thermomicrobiales bacterium]